MADYGNLSGLITKVVPVAGTSPYGTADLDAAINMALVWHSRFRPSTEVYLGTGNGTRAYWDLPDDCLAVRRVEYPISSTPPIFVTTWTTTVGSAGQPQVVFFDPPGSGEVFGIHYAGIWTVADLPDYQTGPLSYLAGAWICMAQAARMAEYIGHSIAADVLDYRGLTSQWLTIKDHLLRMYAQAEGLSASAVQSGAPPIAYGLGTIVRSEMFRRWLWTSSFEDDDDL